MLHHPACPARLGGVECIGCGLPPAADLARRCEFALCRSAAEVEIITEAPGDPLRVCRLHVTPVLTWGVADGPKIKNIRRLGSSPHGSAA